jgi:hypothetical protein
MGYGTGRKIAAATVAALALLGLSACGKKDSSNDNGNASANGNAEIGSSGTAATITPTTHAGSTSGTIPGSATGDTVQWATTASATTSYGTDPKSSWSAEQATGAPDVTADVQADECGDIGQAWASAARDTVDTLTLGYAKSVIPTGVNIRQTYNPGAIVKVVVSGSGGQSSVVYQGQPTVGTTCPTFLVVKVTGVEFAVNSVAVTVDQSQVQSWAEIDAVQLVGNLPS